MKIIFIITLLTTSFLNIYSQNNLCNGANPFCTGMTYNFPAPVNYGTAEIGPDYGCLTTQPNPTWYYLLIDQPGNLSLDIHSTPQHDIDFICWGPFENKITPCNTELMCPANLGSHTTSGPGGGYPLFNTVDCSGAPSFQEWCYIPNAKSGEYYLLLITNYSNQACNIVLSQTNIGQINSATTNCCACVCFFDNITFQINTCDTITNQFSLSGNMFFHFSPSNYTMPGQIIITDQPSGISQVFSVPILNSLSPLEYNLSGIPIDGLQHTLTATFTDAPNCTYTVTYNTQNICNQCSVYAGENITVCGLQTNLNAIELASDINSHWIPHSGICFNSKNNPTTEISANTFGNYDLVWQVTNSNGFLCTDTLTVEFIDPALCTTINETTFNNTFSIYPNPATNGNFTLKYSSKASEKILIRIITSHGLKIYNKEYNKNIESIEIPINTVNFSKGYYIVELISGNNIYRNTLIIQ